MKMSVRDLIEYKEESLDFLEKLKETEQIYIVGLDVPLSITKGLFSIFEAKRKEEAKKRNIPEEQFDIEAFFGFLLGLST